MWTFLMLDLPPSSVATVGFCAGALTTISFAPQLLKAWKTGGEGLSWAMLALFGTGVGLWFLYGILCASFPIVLANGLTEIQVMAIFTIKVRHAWSNNGVHAQQVSGSAATAKKSSAS
jgi:MtN3 and saliva related transmembrane protein